MGIDGCPQTLLNHIRYRRTGKFYELNQSFAHTQRNIRNIHEFPECCPTQALCAEICIFSHESQLEPLT